jgi:hypothetical protein
MRSFFSLHQSLVCSRLGVPAVDARSPSLRTGWYVTVSTACCNRCDHPRFRLPGARRDRSQSTMFLMPAFITFGSWAFFASEP